MNAPTPPPPDSPLPADLPSVLPPEEEKAKSGVRDNALARAEDRFLAQALSEHAVEAARLKNDLSLAHIKNMRADRRMRLTYAGRILRYLEAYSGGVLLLLFLAGFKIWGFALEAGVMATLVGSTAVAAIGLVGFIARGLFRPPPPSRPPKK